MQRVEHYGLNMGSPKYKPTFEPVETSELAATILGEIEHCYRPLIQNILDKGFKTTQDNFNPIRVLMPLVEIVSRIEFGGEAQKLLKKLNVPEPDLMWRMFRHGLTHSIRPFNIVTEQGKYTWAVPQYSCEHYQTGTSIGIYAPKLLDDLETYLETFRLNDKLVKIQTGLEVLSTTELEEGVEICRKTKELGNQELLEYFSEHIRYEVQMLLNAAWAISKKLQIQQGLEFMIVEAYAVHLRNLIAFLYPESTRDDDVCAKDFFLDEITWEQVRPEAGEGMKKARKRAHKEVSHLTTSRQFGTPKGKEWNIAGFTGEVMPVFEKFIESADKVDLKESGGELIVMYRKIAPELI